MSLSKGIQRRFASSTTRTPTSAPRAAVTYQPKSLYTTNALSLPRLPIPNVQETIERYRQSVVCLKSESEVRAHMALLDRFAKGSAECLNEELIKIDAAAERSGKYPYSYIERMWDDGYLAYRGSSPINVSPAFGLKPIERLEGSQANVAACYVHACMRWYRKFMDGDLDLSDGLDKNCISQLPAQFGCCRVPATGKDKQHIEWDPKHIIVLHRGHVFRVDIFDKEGKAVAPQALKSTFQHIIEVTDSHNRFPVGVLTAGGRDDCNAYFRELMRVSETNASNVRDVHTCFMIVCLDSHTAPDSDAKLQAMLHGIDSDRNNRWFDRHQLIVSKDGYVSMNFEHAFSDGATWNRWLSEVWHHINGSTFDTNFSPLPALDMSTDDVAPFQPLTFELPSSIHGILNSAQQEWLNSTNNVKQHLVAADFGKKRLKQYQISPDAFMQMAFHLAFYRMTGRMAPTYESCSTNGFFHGRTETIRSATPEMQALVSNNVFKSLSASNNDELASAKALAHAAANRHVQLARLAQKGFGVDRHLFALKDLAVNHFACGKSEDALSFFNDPLFAYSGNWQMSSSNVSAPHLDMFCFGPVVEHGYGLGYLILDDRVHVCVSTFGTSRKASVMGMRDGIQQAVRDLSYVLSSGTTPSS